MEIIKMKKQGFGKRIQVARKEAGYSQKRLMDALGWPNDSNARLSGYENEQREPTLADFERLAALCHVDAAYLAFGTYRLDPEDSAVLQHYGNASDDIKFAVRAALRVTVQKNQRLAGE